MHRSERKLGHIETMMALMHRDMGGTTQGAQAIRLAGDIRFAALKHAALLVYRKYAALRCVIEEGDGALHFSSRDDFSRILVKQVYLRHADEWEAVLDHEIHDVLDPDEGLWRLTQVTGPEADRHGLIFVYHHAIMDAAAVHAVLDDLFAFTDRLMAGAIPSVAPAGMPAAVDDFLAPAAASLAQAPSCGTIPHAGSAPLEERRTRFLRAAVAASDLARLKSRCRQDGLEVNALLSAALSQAAYSCGLTPSPASFKTAVSLRDCAASQGAAADRLGCYLAVADTPLQIEGLDIEQIARAYQKQLMAYVIRHCFRRQTFDFANWPGHRARLRDSNRFNGFGITNIGEVSLARTYANFSLTDYLPLANRVAGNHAFALHAAEFDGQLKLVYVYPEPLLGEAAMLELRSAFARKLADYCEECTV